MDKRLFHFLIRRPASWLACTQVAWAKLQRTPQVTVWREELRIQIGRGEGLSVRWREQSMKPR